MNLYYSHVLISLFSEISVRVFNRSFKNLGVPLILAQALCNTHVKVNDVFLWYLKRNICHLKLFLEIMSELFEI